MKPTNAVGGNFGSFSNRHVLATGQGAVLAKRCKRLREVRRASERAAKKAKAQEMRLRRLLHKDNQRLCIPRSKFLLEELGIHVVDDRNIVVASHCSVEALLEEIENG